MRRRRRRTTTINIWTMVATTVHLSPPSSSVLLHPPPPSASSSAFPSSSSSLSLHLSSDVRSGSKSMRNRGMNTMIVSGRAGREWEVKQGRPIIHTHTQSWTGCKHPRHPLRPPTPSSRRFSASVGPPPSTTGGPWRSSTAEPHGGSWRAAPASRSTPPGGASWRVRSSAGVRRRAAMRGSPAQRGPAQQGPAMTGPEQRGRRRAAGAEATQRRGDAVTRQGGAGKRQKCASVGVAGGHVGSAGRALQRGRPEWRRAPTDRLSDRLTAPTHRGSAHESCAAPGPRNVGLALCICGSKLSGHLGMAKP